MKNVLNQNLLFVFQTYVKQLFFIEIEGKKRQWLKLLQGQLYIRMLQEIV